MYVLDLRWLGFALLLSVIAVGAAAVVVDRYRRERRHTRIGTSQAALALIEPLLEQAPFGLLLVRGQRYRYANRYARRLLQLDASTGTLPDTDWVELLREDVTSTEEDAGRYRSVTLDQDRTVRWWITPYDGSSVVFVQDVTARQRAEQTTRVLLSDLSHELRTPLSTILTHTEVLQLSSVSDEVHAQSLDFIRDETQRILRMVQNMLELSRLETSAEVDHRPIDLLELVEEALAQAQLDARQRDIQVSLEADAPLPPVVGNRDQLKQVFLNLLDNAIKYSDAGDRVTVSLRAQGVGIRCQVSDTGPGIPTKHLPHVTKRFYRAVPSGMAGSGLGLALVDEILRRHQSTLDVESETEGAETGTCVAFVLPAVEGSRHG